ncbi:MAG: YggS family pyridoxal phosphate-dependent enzyme [Bacteroidota bacterium]|nr:YggS family pyridoxal phosphate-dependent enzyme [Bacteroidota bacterium]
MTIRKNLDQITSSIPPHVTLVAVSKTKPLGDLMQAYKAGQRVFGENKVQEMVEKYHLMPGDVQWHMIGHLQRNKVKYMAGFVYLIHGVDSLKLLTEIDKQAQKHNRVIKCLLQIKIARETSKFGLSIKEAEALLGSETFQSLKNVRIVGLMGMASFTTDKLQISKEFKTLKSNFNQLKKERKNLKIISMGMSGDYKLAIDCGSTMIRVGSLIFGARNYN